jgi:cellulose synthase/poly-beta-1,6-N-acetylglucosamine synthase-like glycosyltransferase
MLDDRGMIEALAQLVATYQGLFVVALLVTLVLSLAYALRLFAQQAVENPAPIVQSSLSIPVSIIAPALNEEAVVVAAVQSLLNQNYPEFEVILVDDGSTDGTVAALHAAFDLAPSDIRIKAVFDSGEVTAFYRSQKDPRLSVVCKVNRGSKADAVNCGINFAAYRYLCCVDGDTIYSGNALLDGMAIVLKNPAEVVGVTSYFGTSRHPEANIAGTRRRVDTHWLSVLQNIDLMRSFLVNRLAFSAIGAMMCSPGAFAIWRRDLFTELGPFDPRFSCEDIEFTYRTHEHFRRLKRSYQIASLPRLIAMTEGPDSVRDLIKQRARWQRVLLESVWAYRRMWFNPRYGTVGLVALPYNILFEALSPLMQGLSLVLLVLLGMQGVLDGFSTGAVLVFTALIVAAPSMLAVLIDNRQHRDYRTRDLVTMSLYSLLDLVLFKPIILVAGLKGSVDFLRGKKGWDKFERNARAPAGR